MFKKALRSIKNEIERLNFERRYLNHALMIVRFNTLARLLRDKQDSMDERTYWDTLHDLEICNQDICDSIEKFYMKNGDDLGEFIYKATKRDMVNYKVDVIMDVDDD